MVPFQLLLLVVFMTSVKASFQGSQDAQNSISDEEENVDSQETILDDRPTQIRRLNESHEILEMFPYSDNPSDHPYDNVIRNVPVQIGHLAIERGENEVTLDELLEASEEQPVLLPVNLLQNINTRSPIAPPFPSFFTPGDDSPINLRRLRNSDDGVHRGFLTASFQDFREPIPVQSNRSTPSGRNSSSSVSGEIASYLSSPVILPQKVNRTRSMIRKDSPPPITLIKFDPEDEDILDYVLECSINNPPQGEKLYGTVIDPENQSLKYVPFPMRYPLERPSSPFDIEDLNPSADNSEIPPHSTSQNPATLPVEEVEEEEIGIQPDFDIPFTQPSQPPAGFRTPPIEAIEPVCPGAPIITVANHGFFRTDQPYDSIFHQDPCELAEINFGKRVRLLSPHQSSYTNVLAEFETLYQFADELGYLSVRLDENHLLAYEYDFHIFYLLVKNCPRKYLLPALALSLRFDQDFDKFLFLYYRLSMDLSLGILFNRESFIMSLILTLPHISQRAFHFFTNSRNALFFLGDADYQFFYGKFSFKVVLDKIKDYEFFRTIHESTVDFSSNPLRSWLLNINVEEFAKAHINSNSFNKDTMVGLINYHTCFPAKTEIGRILFTMFRNLLNSNPNFNIFQIENLNYKLITILFDWALRLSDELVLRWLFEKFMLENGVSKPNPRPLRHSVIQVKFDNPLVVQIKISNIHGSKTILLPKPCILKNNL